MLISWFSGWCWHYHSQQACQTADHSLSHTRSYLYGHLETFPILFVPTKSVFFSKEVSISISISVVTREESKTQPKQTDICNVKKHSVNLSVVLQKLYFPTCPSSHLKQIQRTLWERKSWAWLKLMWIKTLAHCLIREHLPDSRQIQLPWSHATSQHYQSTLFVFRWFDSEVPSSSNNSFLRLMSKLTGNVQQIFIVPRGWIVVILLTPWPSV